MSEKYTQIGKIHKPLGTQGELKLFIEDLFWDDFIRFDHFFIKINGSFVPFFIEDLRETHHLIIKVEEIDDPESALILVNKDIYLETKSIHSATFKKMEEKKGFEGYTIKEGDETIGTIESIELMPQQVIAWIVVNSKRIAIPLVDALIENVDNNRRIIQMKLPAGILDL